MLSLAPPITVGIPKIEPLVIGAEEIKDFYDSKVISTWQYIYFAIKLSYQGETADIDIPTFCNDWQVTEEEFSAAIATIHKKHLSRPLARQLTLDLNWSYDDK